MRRAQWNGSKRVWLIDYSYKYIHNNQPSDTIDYICREIYLYERVVVLVAGCASTFFKLNKHQLWCCFHSSTILLMMTMRFSDFVKISNLIYSIHFLIFNQTCLYIESCNGQVYNKRGASISIAGTYMPLITLQQHQHRIYNGLIWYTLSF